MSSGGMYQCFHCLKDSVVWDADYDFSDFGLEGEGIVHICHCTNCGAVIKYIIADRQKGNMMLIDLNSQDGYILDGKYKVGGVADLIDKKPGKWIKTVDGNGWDDWYVLKCPFCGATIEDKHCHSWEYNFCPNCGADVRGDDEGREDA